MQNIVCQKAQRMLIVLHFRASRSRVPGGMAPVKTRQPPMIKILQIATITESHHLACRNQGQFRSDVLIFLMHPVIRIRQVMHFLHKKAHLTLASNYAGMKHSMQCIYCMLASIIEKAQPHSSLFSEFAKVHKKLTWTATVLLPVLTNRVMSNSAGRQLS